MALTRDYGMHYDPSNRKIVARARESGEDGWSNLPVETLPARTPVHACQATIERRYVDGIASGQLSFRENYPVRLWRDSDGKLYVVDGHTRIAMCYVLNRPISVQIMEESSENHP